MLLDLTIKNYRNFKDFHIDDLARVNLIVGMNNSGKTSLLEAIHLLVNQGNIEALINLLHSRGELAEQSSAILSLETPSRLNSYQIRHIFNEHQLDFEKTISITSQNESSISLQIQLQQPPPVINPFDQNVYSTSEGTATESLGFSLLFSYGQDVKMLVPISDDGLITPQAAKLWREYQNRFFFKTNNPLLVLPANISSFLLTTNNLSFEQLAKFWDGITLTDKEENVIKALKILEPNVQRLSFTSHQTHNTGILLKISGQRDPIPLGSMGEGMRRILTLVMAAVTVENGVLLVDEIDTGLHYEVQTDMWRLLFQVAQQLNIQVFATTHSWDCISAFKEALDQSEDSSIGKLFRLSRKNENIRAVEYTPDELSVAVEEGIEVR
ncbi:MAG: AAA family ATPase [Crinalium sp.]